MKIYLFSALFLLAIAVCSAKENTSQEGANTEIAAEAVATDNNTVVLELTDNGIGPIVLGMNVGDIPVSVAGLYDRVEKETTPDGEEYQFYAGETALFSAGDPDEGIITSISLFNESPIVDKTTKGEAYISQ